ncbi:hypothetical protein [Nocardioides campestrisoli]|uniref:hypothetical protein n=1 Tax=Nocardioides campestrisoli TaxID=2736757 RepID=UPI00163DC3EC|nr:hypothetical protein [Nocardioides campestrisoli]
MLDLFDPSFLDPLLTLADGAPRPAPEPEDVKAGWTALLLWLGMAVAVALLGWSLVRQLRKTNAARDAGVFGDEPAPAAEDERETPRP